MKKWRQKNKEKIKEYRQENKEDAKQYYKDNEEKIKEYQKEWQQKNKENIKQQNKQYYIDNKEYHKQYHIDNTDHIKEYQKQWNRQKYKTNLKFNLNNRMSRAIRESLKGNKAGRHWESLVGYSLNDLIKHLKKTLPKNYNWNDYLDGKLHIDHIIPKSVFNFTKYTQIDFRNCWALKNLQLLPAEENLIKGAKLYKPFQPSLKMAY